MKTRATWRSKLHGENRFQEHRNTTTSSPVFVGIENLLDDDNDETPIVELKCDIRLLTKNKKRKKQVVSPVRDMGWHLLLMDENKHSKSQDDNNFPLLASGGYIFLLECRDQHGNSLFSSQLPIAKVALGISHALILTTCGKLFTYGTGYEGQLGHGDFCDQHTVPRQVQFFEQENLKVKIIAAGGLFSIAITISGQQFVFGDGLGIDFSRLLLVPLQERRRFSNPTEIVLTHEPIVHLSCGAEHILFSTASQQIYSFGKNYQGQLGLNDRLERSIPTLVSSLAKDNNIVEQLACGFAHSFVLMQQGEIYAFGAPEALGLGEFFHPISTPTRLLFNHSVMTSCITTGYRHTLLVDAKKGLFGTGSNQFGQLKMGELESVDELRKIAFDPCRGASCGDHFSLATNDLGQVFVFGVQNKDRSCYLLKHCEIHRLYCRQLFAGSILHAIVFGPMNVHTMHCTCSICRLGKCLFHQKKHFHDIVILANE